MIQPYLDRYTKLDLMSGKLTSDLELTLLADQGTKYWAKASLPTDARGYGIPVPVIENFWDWRLSYNTGSAFGMFHGVSGAQVILTIFGLVALAAIGGQLMRCDLAGKQRATFPQGKRPGADLHRLIGARRMGDPIGARFRQDVEKRIAFAGKGELHVHAALGLDLAGGRPDNDPFGGAAGLICLTVHKIWGSRGLTRPISGV